MKKQKILSILLACGLLFGTVATSCAPNDDGYVLPEEHTVEGTLHKIYTKENPQREFVSKQKTEYTIVQWQDNQAASKAASLIVQNVKRATGATLAVRAYADGMENAWSQDDKLIVLNVKPLFEKAGLTMPNEKFGDSGYYIKTVGNTVFIMNPTDYGYQMGAIKFLNETLGYDMLGKDCWYYGKDGKTIPDMEISEKPDFDYRTPSNDLDLTTAYGMGYNMTGLHDLYMTVSDDSGVNSDRGQHTCYNILPPSIFAEDHPNWFFLPGNVKKEQLCYTVRGAYKTADEDRKNGVANEFNAMLDAALEKCMRVIDANPSKFILPFSARDNEAVCDCAACTELKDDYGAVSAATIIFMKKLDALIQAELEARAAESGTEKRKVWLAFIAYNATATAPAYPDAKGVYHPADESLRLSDTMCVDIAAINTYYTSTFYDDVNMSYGESKALLSWGAVAENIMMWIYQDNYLDYFSPYNTYDTSVMNYRFCYEVGAFSMFSQGQTIMREPTNFTKLKEYVNSKAFVNVNLSYAELEEAFFERYFLDAKEPMYQFFKEMQAHLEYLEKTDVTVTGKVYNDLFAENTQYFSMAQLKGWLNYVDEAYAIVEKYKGNDDTTYVMLQKHILIESLFPRYGLLQKYTSSFTKEQEIAEKKQFKEDCFNLGNTGWGELAKHHLSQLWTIWGV